MIGKIRIGEVAKYFNISKQTLIYYDRINLLKPSNCEENKYRYYTYDDTDKLELILMLKESGLELAAIKDYLESPTHEQGISLLTHQKNVMETKLRQIKKTIKTLDKRIEYMSYYENLEIFQEIQLIEKPIRHIYKVDLNHNLDNPFDTAMKDLKDKLDHHPKLFGVVYSKFSFTKSLDTVLDELPKYISIFDFISSKVDDVHCVTLPASKYICYHHKGPYYTAGESYVKMFKYIEENNLIAVGEAIEVPLIDVWAAKTENEYITELQIPVEVIPQ